MKSSFTKNNIFKLISALDGYERKGIVEEGQAYTLTVFGKNKSVCLTWPNELGEIFLSYSENSEVIFEDWFECLESEEVDDFISYADDVCKRFIFNESRVKTVGFILRNEELQYKLDGIWRNVLHP